MFKSAFDRVKISVAHDIPADVVARELSLTTKQVNEIILARDYDSYKASFE